MENCKRSIMLVLWIVIGIEMVSRGANAKVSAVIAFGDSILDTGNNNHLKTTSKCNFPPYGRDFPGGIPTGRFSDGKVFSDLIAEGLGVKGILPAYSDPNLQPSDLPTGVCFASGGSGLDSITANIQSVLSVLDQLNSFREYKSKLETQVGVNKSNEILSNALFLISFGNNDIAITFYSARLRPLYDIDSYTSLLVNWASDFIKKIYGLGARKIGFMSTLPLGCLPAAREGGLFCNEIVNKAAEMFNSKLSTLVGSLNSTLTDSIISYIDVYNPLLDLVHNPQKNGFKVANVGCCCMGSMSCLDPSRYVFWDLAHPTQRAYNIIANLTMPKCSI